MGDRFGADRLAGSRRAGEVERERKARGVTLAKAPPVEDEIVLSYLGERGVQCAPGRRRQDDVAERTAWHNRLDRAAAAEAEQTSQRSWRHVSTVLRRQRTINADRCRGSPKTVLPSANRSALLEWENSAARDDRLG